MIYKEKIVTTDMTEGIGIVYAYYMNEFVTVSFYLLIIYTS